MLSNNNDTRRFSYAEPVLYGGGSYPSADTTIVDDRGIERKGRIFADANGEYYTLDSKGNALSAMLTETLPEVEVTPSREEALSTMFNGYLTRSDKTRVNNVPHREYNPWLRESAQKGAKEHALWDNEHPNLSAWRDFGTVIPFGVAAAPFVAGTAPLVVQGGDALAATSLGLKTTRGLGLVADATKNILPWADAAITSGFGAKGLQDVSNGTFTPETAMDLMPLWQLGNVRKGILNIKDSSKQSISSMFNNASRASNEGSNSFSFIEDPLLMHIKRAKVKGYDPSTINILDLSQDTPESLAFYKRTAKEFDMTPERVKEELISHLDTHGHASAPTWEKTIIHDGKAGKDTNILISHELDHILHYPNEPIKDGIFFPRIKNLYGDEFIKHNNTEVSARGSQLHDYFGHTGNEPITEDMLKYARDNYVKDTGINNNMNDLLWSVNDYKGLADWMTKYATGIIPFGIIGTTSSNKE